MSGWRAALRIARRSVRRHLGRSLLIVALIAVPVAGMTVADGLVRTITDRDVDVDRYMGSADVRIDVTDRKSFDLKEVLPAGAHAVPLRNPGYAGTLRLGLGDRIVRSRLSQVVVGDPLTAHLARLAEGRLPRNSGEALVTRPLAEQLGLLDADGGLRLPATVRTANGVTATVTGLAVVPYCLTCADVVALPNTRLTKALLDERSPIPGAYLVDLPDDVDVAELARAWPVDHSTVTTRDSYTDYTPVDRYLTGTLRLSILLFVGLGLFGIVLTAGAAFAVGARMQVRELGLVAANGGEAKHVRRIVLAQGLVLGVLGAAVGLLLGAAATVLGVPIWQKITDQLLENLRFGWGELVGAAALGVVACVLSALVPAFAVARMQPTDALAGRFHSTSPRARPRRLGVFLVLAGLAVIAVSGVVSHGRVAARHEQFGEFGPGPSLDRTLPALGMLGGLAVAIAGLILVLPALVSAIGRLGTRLPLSGRLALRDAVRHRHRTVAAGAAVMVTIAASVVTAFVFTAQRANVPHMLPPNTALAQLDMAAQSEEAAGGDRLIDDVVADTPRTVPGAAAIRLEYAIAYPNHEAMDPIVLEPGSSEPKPGCLGGLTEVAVGTPDLIELSTGRQPDAAVRSALADGKVVSFDQCVTVSNGTVLAFAKGANLTLPVYEASGPPGIEDYDWRLPKVFISPETIAAHDWGRHASSLAITYPGPSDLEAVRTAVEDAGMTFYVDEPTGSSYTSGLYYLLAVLAGLVAFLGAGVTVALSATDGRADLATLAALGAQPRRRRALAGAQALVVTGVGAVVGLALGVCTGLAAVPVAGYLAFSVPWQHLLVVALAVPLAASVVAAVVTPSRLVS